jgi:hypothetical protein
MTVRSASTSKLEFGFSRRSNFVPLAPIVIGSPMLTSAVGQNTATIPAPASINTGDRILVLAGGSNPGGTPTCSGAGLTFGSVQVGTNIGLWIATSPDTTPRTVTVGCAGTVTGLAIILRGVASGAGGGATGSYTATTTPTVPAATGTAPYLSVAGITHASYPSTPNFSAPSGWTMFSNIQNTGWNGIALALKEGGSGDAVFGATPSYAGNWATCTVQ